MSDNVIDRVSPNLLFRHRLNCQATKQSWGTTGVALKDTHLIPSFGRSEGQNEFAQLKMAWSAEGLFFDVVVTGKNQSIWCRPTQILESDSVMVFVDTRNTQSIHRASRFCHWFVFLPAGMSGDREKPGGMMLKINRSKEDPKTFQAFKSYVACKKKPTGYRMQFHIAAAALTGWDSGENRQIGFNFLIKDRELGEQTLATGSSFPIASDPSLWHPVRLV